MRNVIPALGNIEDDGIRRLFLHEVFRTFSYIVTDDNADDDNGGNLESAEDARQKLAMAIALLNQDQTHMDTVKKQKEALEHEKALEATRLAFENERASKNKQQIISIDR